MVCWQGRGVGWVVKRGALQTEETSRRHMLLRAGGVCELVGHGLFVGMCGCRRGSVQESSDPAAGCRVAVLEPQPEPDAKHRSLLELSA